MGKKLIGVPHSIKELGASENVIPIASQNLYAIDWHREFYHGWTHVEHINPPTDFFHLIPVLLFFYLCIYLSMYLSIPTKQMETNSGTLPNLVLYSFRCINYRQTCIVSGVPLHSFPNLVYTDLCSLYTLFFANTLFFQWNIISCLLACTPSYFYYLYSLIDICFLCLYGT